MAPEETMVDTREKRQDEARTDAQVHVAGEDQRKPYESPRLLKKRSVARATLFTPPAKKPTPVH
jgi:hypothetical protein